MVSGIPVDLKVDVSASKIWKIEKRCAKVSVFYSGYLYFLLGLLCVILFASYSLYHCINYYYYFTIAILLCFVDGALPVQYLPYNMKGLGGWLKTESKNCDDTRKLSCSFTAGGQAIFKYPLHDAESRFAELFTNENPHWNPTTSSQNNYASPTAITTMIMCLLERRLARPRKCKLSITTQWTMELLNREITQRAPEYISCKKTAEFTNHEI